MVIMTLFTHLLDSHVMFALTWFSETKQALELHNLSIKGQRWDRIKHHRESASKTFPSITSVRFVVAGSLGTVTGTVTAKARIILECRTVTMLNFEQYR